MCKYTYKKNMVEFSAEKLNQLLKGLKGSRNKIIELSSWLLHHNKHYKIIVKVWFQQLIKARDERKVTLLYLLNEIVQHGKKYPEYVSEFGNILPKAFDHLSKLSTYEEKLDKDVIKLLKIWNKRKIFSKKQIFSLSKKLDCSISKYGMASQTIALNNISFEDVNEFIMSPYIRGVKTEDEALIGRIQLLKEPPTCDAKVRGEIGGLPREVFDTEALKNLKSKKSAYELEKRVDYALQVTKKYNSRLMCEMENRKKLKFQLNKFTNAQKEMILRGKERLKKYRVKLIRIKRLQRQLISYVENIPEWQDSEEITPLPCNGDASK